MEFLAFVLLFILAFVAHRNVRAANNAAHGLGIKVARLEREVVELIQAVARRPAEVQVNVVEDPIEEQADETTVVLNEVLVVEEPAEAPPIIETVAAEPEAVARVAERDTTTALPASAVLQDPKSTITHDVERTFATRGAVWVGGIALAIGAVMILRYSIEAGFFGPGVRLAMGAVFAIALAVLSEVVRRRDLTARLKVNLGGFPPDQIPTVLAGVSVFSAFAVIYAAYAVYGMIGTSVAFSGMGLLGLAALGASLIHGPWFGLFGLVASYATPLLIGGDGGNLQALSIFIAFVTGTAFALHRARSAIPILAGAIAGHSLWTGLIGLSEGFPFWGPALGFVAVILATINSEKTRPSPNNRIEAYLGQAAFALPLIMAGILWVKAGGGWWVAFSLLIIVAATVSAAIRHRGYALLAPLATAGSIGMVLLWPLASGPYSLSPALFVNVISLRVTQNIAPGLGLFAVLLALIIFLPMTAALAGRIRNGTGDVWARGSLAFAGALTPVGIMLAANLRFHAFERTTLFALISFSVMAGLAAVSDRLFHQERLTANPKLAPNAFMGSAAYAVGAALALGLGVAFAFRETWLVVGFAIASCIVALITLSRPIPLLRTISSALGTAALTRVLWQPLVDDVGAIPVFNWLLVFYGLPALAFAIAAMALSTRRDRPLGVVEGLAAMFLAALVVLEVVQGFFGTNLTALNAMFYWGRQTSLTSAEWSKLTGLAALLLIGLALLAMLFATTRDATGSLVLSIAEKSATVILIGIALAGLCLFANPALVGAQISEMPVFNRLLFGYVGTGVVLGLLSLMLSPIHARLKSCLEALCLVLTIVGATLVVRHCFSGPVVGALTGPAIGFAETVSTVLLWLSAALMVSYWRADKPSRVLDAALLVITVGTLGYTALMLGLVRNPLFDNSLVSGPIIFNRILWGYGPVALGLIVVGFLARDVRHGLMPAMMAGGAATGVLMLILLIRHALHGATLYSDIPFTMAETGIYGAAVLGVAFLLTCLTILNLGSKHARNQHIAIGTMGGIAFLFLACFAGGGAVANWILINGSIVGVLLPAVLCIGLSVWTRNAVADINVSRIYGLAAVALGLGFVLLQVRFAFPETDWSEAWASPSHRLRLFGYSIVMILYGAGLLLLGFGSRHTDLRIAALGVIAIAAVKVFLLDLAGLSGLWRAFSFIGLGASLIGIAYFYRMQTIDEKAVIGRQDG